MGWGGGVRNCLSGSCHSCQNWHQTLRAFKFFSSSSIYRICPNRSACPNRRAPPCSKKHITSNSQQMPDKNLKRSSKNSEKHESLSGIPVCLAADTCKSPLPCKQKSTRFLFTVYVHIVGTGWQALLLKLIDAHPSPCTASIRTYTVCQHHTCR